MDLFIPEPELSFERPKIAATQLDEDPSMWPRQVLQELFRQVPEASEYVPRVMMVTVDKEQGYGLGAIVIASTTDSSMSTTEAGATAKQALVPVVIKQNMLQPLDLLMTKNKMRPLTGDRLREALFRPSTFELMTKDWGDQSLYNLFYPPGRTDNDFASGVSTTSSGNSPSAGYGAGMKYSSLRKEAGYYKQLGFGSDDEYLGAFHRAHGEATQNKSPSFTIGKTKKDKYVLHQGQYLPESMVKKSFLIEKVAPTITKRDMQKLAEALHSDPALKRQMKENPSFRECVAKLAEYEGSAVSDVTPLFQKVERLMPVHVAQFGYDEGRAAYWVKTSCRKYAYRSQPQYMSRKELLKVAGPEAVEKVDTEGTVTVAQPNQDDTPFKMDASKWSVVEEPGVYRVMSEAGKEMMGWVIPNLIDMDGTRLPMSIFTNGAAAMVQDQVAGSRISDGVNLPSSQPEGTGAFYMAGPDKVEATVPVTVIGQEAGMDGAEVYHVKTVMGGDYQIKMVPGLKKMMAEKGDGVVLMPDTANFMKLEEEMQVPLISEPQDLTKTSAYMAAPKIWVSSDGLQFNLRFENMPKLAMVYPHMLDRDEAAFALCVAGMDPTKAQGALNKVAHYRVTEEIFGVYDVQLARTTMEAALEKGQKVAAVTSGLRRDCIKEAAVLPDIQTVDTVLSLGFINPENVRMYVGHLPYLDRALSAVCELTLAARLGLTEIPEFAAARACRALNEVIEGLKALALREVDENAAA